MIYHDDEVHWEDTMKKLNRFQVANRLGVTTRTLRRWDNKGKLIPFRDASNHPFYTSEQVSRFLKKEYKVKYKVIWVSTALDKDKLKELMKRYHNNYLLLQSPKDVSINKNEQLSEIITYALVSQLTELVVCKKNLLDRQAFEVLKLFLERFNTQVMSVD